MSLIFSNKPLNLTALGSVWSAAIPLNNSTLAVYNEQARATTLDLGRGSTDAPTAAQKFGAQLSWKGSALPAIVIGVDDDSDLRTLGIFVSKGEDFVLLSGSALRITELIGSPETGIQYGQIGIFEVGAILELNCSQEQPDEAPEYWELDPVLGWQQVNIWDVPELLQPV